MDFIQAKQDQEDAEAGEGREEGAEGGEEVSGEDEEDEPVYVSLRYHACIHNQQNRHTGTRAATLVIKASQKALLALSCQAA